MQDSEGLGGEWYAMLSTILNALRGEHDYLRCKVNLAPLKSANLVSALAGEQEPPDDVGEAVSAEARPEPPQLFRRQHSFSASAVVGFSRAGYWICVKQSFTDAP
jgi:hypothetical protein